MGKFIDRTGETNIALNGQKMTIIAYRRYEDVDVEFEDGTISQHNSYNAFKKGCIRNKNIMINKRVGETSISKNGQKITIIKYKRSIDIDIQFEDGTIIEHVSYNAFLHGQISNPNIKLGETNIASNGQKMTIVNYKNSTDINVQFEDGTTIYHTKYKLFLSGKIKNPNLLPPAKNSYQHIGENKINHDGLSMIIVNYTNYHNIDIQVENDFILKNKDYGNFKTGHIKIIPCRMNDIIIKKSNHNGTYYCICPKCNYKDNMTITEVKQHSCKE